MIGTLGFEVVDFVVVGMKDVRGPATFEIGRIAHATNNQHMALEKIGAEVAGKNDRRGKGPAVAHDGAFGRLIHCEGTGRRIVNIRASQHVHGVRDGSSSDRRGPGKTSENHRLIVGSFGRLRHPLHLMAGAGGAHRAGNEELSLRHAVEFGRAGGVAPGHDATGDKNVANLRTRKRFRFGCGKSRGTH
jgi:hypothetical protein